MLAFAPPILALVVDVVIAHVAPLARAVGVELVGLVLAGEVESEAYGRSRVGGAFDLVADIGITLKLRLSVSGITPRAR